MRYLYSIEEEQLRIYKGDNDLHYDNLIVDLHIPIKDSSHKRFSRLIKQHPEHEIEEVGEDGESTEVYWTFYELPINLLHLIPFRIPHYSYIRLEKYHKKYIPEKLLNALKENSYGISLS